MAKVRYTADAGLYHEGGEGFILESMGSHVASGSVNSFTGNTTYALTVPGVYSTTNGNTLTLPDPTDCPGGIFVIQQTDGTGTTVNPKQDCTLISTFNDDGNAGDGTNRNGVSGKTMASAGTANESCALMSDGMNWHLIGFRGTWNIT